MIMKKILFWFLTAVKIHHLIRFINRKKIVIVMYHGILKENMPVPCWWQMPYREFKWQLEYLKKHYIVMHLQEVMQKIQRKEGLPDNVAVITFDDGFKNNYSTAFPLLKQLNLPATIFLTTDLIGTGRLLWYDGLFMLLLETKVKKIDLKNFGLDIFDLTKDNKPQIYNVIEDKLKTLKPNEKKDMMSFIKNILSAQINPTSYADNFKLLSWQEVDLMNESGLIHWGGHTCTHEILSNLDDKTLSKEIKNSCARISKYEKDLLFAYPNGRKGDFDQRAKVILKQLNVLCSVTSVSGLNPYSQDPYELKRISVGYDMTRPRFKLLCSGVI